MPETETLEIDVKGGTVQAALRLPDADNARGQPPGILICRGLHVEGDDAAGFFDELTDGLVASGMAVARFEHRSAGLILEDFDTHTVADELDDARSVYNRLAEHPRLQRQHSGVIGYGLGAIAAAGLARLVPGISRLCLIAPTTAEHLRSHLTKSNGSPAALDPSRIPASYMTALELSDTPRDVATNNRPTLLIHGAADRFIPHEVSLEYQKAMESVGRDVTRILIARADHAFTEANHRSACIECVSRFFGVMVQQPVLAGQS